MVEPTSIASGRPREPRVDDAVRSAVLSLLAERGYQGTTIAAIADRAGVGRGALYRRWRSKGEMVFAAVVHGLELADPPEHGSLAGDLRALGERIAQLSNSGTAHAAMLGLTAELDTDHGLRETLDAGLWAVERRYLAVILDRAAARGEIRAGVDPELVRRLLVGAIAIAPIYGGGPTAAGEAAAIVAAGLCARYPSAASQIRDRPNRR
jgi:AcrR family transcriptional regulator